MDVRTVSVFVFLLCAAAWSEGRNRTLTEEEKDRLLQLWLKRGPNYAEYNNEVHEFPCDPLPKSASVPTSVHKLRPADIKVIGAMGDSLTAGTGIEAATVFGVLIQNRGQSWSGGGETSFEDQITLPNIMKKYNQHVYGYATGNGNEFSTRSMFNVAVSGSTSRDLVNQAQELVKRMRNDPNVDIEKDWKVVTILSGNNDLCDFCDSGAEVNRERFHAHVTAALDILHTELPRTLVNLVQPLNMEIVTELNRGLLCSALHFFVCECAAFPENEEAEVQLILQVDMFQRVVDDISRSGRYDTREDFTVVSQPFFNDTYLPRLEDGQPDMSYFATDCFHLSRKGQAAAASALWNNMIEPVHNKSTKWAPGEAIECPTEANPYIYTNKNSHETKHGLRWHREEVADDVPGDEEKKEMRIWQPSHSSVVITVSACSAVIVIVTVIVVCLRRNRRQSAYDKI